MPLYQRELQIVVRSYDRQPQDRATDILVNQTRDLVLTGGLKKLYHDLCMPAGADDKKC